MTHSKIGKYKGYLGRISTEQNLTGPVVSTSEVLSTKCSALAIDSLYGQVIVGYEVESNTFGDAFLESNDAWNPAVPRNKNGNVAIVAYPFDCISSLFFRFVVLKSVLTSSIVKTESWTTLLGDREENDNLTGIAVFEQNVTVVFNSKKRVFSPLSSSDGYLYSLDVSNGRVLANPTIFGATSFHNALAVYPSLQVKLLNITAQF